LYVLEARNVHEPFWVSTGYAKMVWNGIDVVTVAVPIG
jgi:hypothetical protein